MHSLPAEEFGGSLASPPDKLARSYPTARSARRASSAPRSPRARRTTSLDTGAQVGNPYEQHRSLNASLVTTLRFLGKHFEAERVESCHESFLGWECKDHGHKFARPLKSCQFKLCAWDMRARSQRLQAKFRLQWPKVRRPKYAVFSQVNCELVELKQGLRNLWDAFERLRHRKIWRNVRGAVVSLEITFNRASSTWHPHLNVLFDGPYIPQEKLLAAWQQCSEVRADAGVFITAATPDTLAEVFKYVTKVSDIVDSPDAVRFFLNCTRQQRFIRTYGEFYDLDDLEDTSALICPDCGSHEVRQIGRVAPQQLWLDDGGVLRFYRCESESPPASTHPGTSVAEDFALAPVEVLNVEQRRLAFLSSLPAVLVERPSLFASGD